MNGLSKPVLSQLSVQLLLPTIMLATAIIIYSMEMFTVYSLIYTTIFATFISAVVGMFLIKREVKDKTKGIKKEYKIKLWYKALIPFSLISFVTTLNTEFGTVLLGLYSNYESVGYFRVALQAVGLIILTLSAMNTVLMPKISQSYNDGNLIETQKLLTKSVRVSAVTSIPIFMALVFFGDEIILLLFGEEYLSSYVLIIILSVGQLINVLSGSVATVLNMSGNESKTLKKLFLSLLINLGFMFVLVPPYGEIGASIAVTLGIIFWNISLSIDVKNITGLKAHIFCKG